MNYSSLPVTEALLNGVTPPVSVVTASQQSGPLDVWGLLRTLGTLGTPGAAAMAAPDIANAQQNGVTTPIGSATGAQISALTTNPIDALLTNLPAEGKALAVNAGVLVVGVGLVLIGALVLVGGPSTVVKLAAPEASAAASASRRR